MAVNVNDFAKQARVHVIKKGLKDLNSDMGLDPKLSSSLGVLSRYDADASSAAYQVGKESMTLFELALKTGNGNLATKFAAQGIKSVFNKDTGSVQEIDFQGKPAKQVVQQLLEDGVVTSKKSVLQMVRDVLGGTSNEKVGPKKGDSKGGDSKDAPKKDAPKPDLIPTEQKKADELQKIVDMPNEAREARLWEELSKGSNADKAIIAALQADKPGRFYGVSIHGADVNKVFNEHIGEIAPASQVLAAFKEVSGFNLVEAFKKNPAKSVDINKANQYIKVGLAKPQILNMKGQLDSKALEALQPSVSTAEKPSQAPAAGEAAKKQPTAEEIAAGKRAELWKILKDGAINEKAVAGLIKQGADVNKVFNEHIYEVTPEIAANFRKIKDFDTYAALGNNKSPTTPQEIEEIKKLYKAYVDLGTPAGDIHTIPGIGKVPGMLELEAQYHSMQQEMAKQKATDEAAAVAEKQKPAAAPLKPKVVETIDPAKVKDTKSFLDKLGQAINGGELEVFDLSSVDFSKINIYQPIEISVNSEGYAVNKDDTVLTLMAVLGKEGDASEKTHPEFLREAAKVYTEIVDKYPELVGASDHTGNVS